MYPLSLTNRKGRKGGRPAGPERLTSKSPRFINLPCLRSPIF
ncbi:hypothetical protein [Nostoc sp. TCL240-02]|nr:hypothetical protein [Nostoc sp. TCL240-02]